MGVTAPPSNGVKYVASQASNGIIFSKWVICLGLVFVLSGVCVALYDPGFDSLNSTSGVIRFLLLTVAVRMEWLVDE